MKAHPSVQHKPPLYHGKQSSQDFQRCPSGRPRGSPLKDISNIYNIEANEGVVYITPDGESIEEAAESIFDMKGSFASSTEKQGS